MIKIIEPRKVFCNVGYKRTLGRDLETLARDYSNLIDSISVPGAKIYLESILPVSLSKTKEFRVNALIKE